MPAAPLSISVIIPSRDTRDLTMRCLAALAASESPAAEIWLVDDGSRDGTSEAVRAAFPATHLIESSTPHGFTASMNTAWPRTHGDIVLLLNSDTEIDPRALTNVAHAFAEDARLGIAGASLVHPDGKPQWSAGREPTALWLFAMSSGFTSGLGRIRAWRRVRPESQADGDTAWVPATAMAVRREVTTTIGPFDPTLGTYAQDLDYCVRAHAAGWRVKQLSNVRVMHVGGATIAQSDREAGMRQDPVAMFADLDRWIAKAHDAPTSRRLRRALEAGYRSRIAARQLLRWLRGRAARAAWDRETTRYRAAVALARRSIASR